MTGFCAACEKPYQDVDNAGCPRHESVNEHDEDDWADYIGKAGA